MFIIKKNDFTTAATFRTKADARNYLFEHHFDLADFELIEIEIDRNISVTTTSSQLFSWSLVLVLPSVFNGNIKEIFLVSMIL